jgi:hypothetical protein
MKSIAILNQGRESRLRQPSTRHTDWCKYGAIKHITSKVNFVREEQVK